MIKFNKSILVGGLLGGIYALIPFLVSLSNQGGGDPGPYFIFMLPPFWLAMGTLLLSWPMLSIFPLIGFPAPQEFLFNMVGNIINILLWIMIGGCFFSIVKKKKGGWVWMIILAVLILVSLAITLFYILG